MRIAHVTSGICRRSAGLGAAVASISAAAESDGNEVQVFGLSSPEWAAGDHSTWTGAPALVFESARWSGPLGYAPGMLNALLDFNPDIVHLHGLWTYPSIAVNQWYQRTKRPYVVSAHGMLFSVSLGYKSFRKRAARRLFQDKVLHAASVLHATSSDEERAYRDVGFHNHTELIPLGLQSVAPQKAAPDRPGRRALFLGRLHHQKGIDWLIEAWTNLERDFPDWELVIVGPEDPNYTPDIQRLRHMASGRRVSFLKPLYGEEKTTFMAGSDLFLMPSRSENFGLTAAESLMLEVPVIATKGTPWSGLVSSDAGWWIETGAHALEDAMRVAMQMSRSELHAKGQNGRRWIEANYSRPAIGARWKRVYESLS